VNWRRIITAAILALSAISLILAIDDLWFDLICGGIVVLGLWEWAILKGQGILAFFVSVIPFAVLVFLGREHPALLMTLCLLSSCLWMGISVDLVINRLDSFHGAVNSYFMGMFLMSGTWSALVLIHSWTDVGPILLISVLLMVWATDISAYFVGKGFGRRKLAPELSPGKTIEGVFGGMAGSLALACITGFAMLGLDAGKLLLWIALGLIIGTVCIIGDLYESRLKRIAGVKDSGQMLPGHGGILDRIDSMIAALPVMAAGWPLLR